MDIPFARAGMSASGLNTGWFSQLSEAAFMTDFFSSPVGKLYDFMRFCNCLFWGLFFNFNSHEGTICA